MWPSRTRPPWFALGLPQRQQTGVLRGTPPTFQPCHGVSCSFSFLLILHSSLFDAGTPLLASVFVWKVSHCSLGFRSPGASPVTISASVYLHFSWVSLAYATLLQDVFHNLIPRFCRPRGLRRCGLVPWFVDLQTLARSAGGLRSLVGPASVVDSVCRPFADRRMVFRLLFSRTALQLSPFHGHGLPGVSLLR